MIHPSTTFRCQAGGPVMVTFSKGGGQFLAGKAADNSDDAASIAGTIAGALHVRQVRAVPGDVVGC